MCMLQCSAALHHMQDIYACPEAYIHTVYNVKHVCKIAVLMSVAMQAHTGASIYNCRWCPNAAAAWQYKLKPIGCRALTAKAIMFASALGKQILGALLGACITSAADLIGHSPSTVL